MPGTDRVIDPLTKDYVSDGKGGYVTTTSLQTAAYHQLQGELDHWVGDPDAGGLLYTLARGQADQATALRAKDYLLSALQPLADAGLADQLSADVSRDASGRISLSGSLRDLQDGTTLEVDDLMSHGA